MKKKKVVFSSIIAIFIIIAIVFAVITYKSVNTISSEIKQELLRSENYTQVTEDDETVENCEYVKFSSFFTRDLDGDEKAEKILGSCRNVNYKDTLYIDLNVLTNGYLKDGKITIDSKNFNYSMKMVKDTVLSQNYISDSVREIELNKVNSGTQKLIIGNVIANIGNNVDNYSKISTVTLTGTHVSDEGLETPINKTVEITVDWYGTVDISLYRGYKYYNYDDLKSETVSFSFTTEEITKELILKENVSKVTIPELNGYKPTEVKCTNSNIESDYNEKIRELTITRSSKCNENGMVTSNLSRSNTYNIEVTYPKEAYDAISSYINLEIPITSYYTGYNNKNEEFTNPYQSDTTYGEVNLIFRETPKGNIYNFYVDINNKRYDNYAGRYVISKKDLINLYDSEEEIKNKEYIVKWQATRGTDGEVPSMIMSETKEETENQSYGDKWNNIIMEEYVTNTGIYFSNADRFLEENGTISIYNNDTNELIKTFNKEEWNKYTSQNPYKYEKGIKHIRIETSKTNRNSSLTIYNIKELETEKILSNFTKEQVKDIELIYTYLTGICNIEGQEPGTINCVDYAYYTSERSKSMLEIEKDKMPTQETNSQHIEIKTVDNGIGCAKWKNGEFLVEIPEEIINMEINRISVDNENVKIVAYDLIKKDEKYFIKIITENEEEATYTIAIDCKMTPDPRTPTTNKNFKLYSYNQYCTDYYNETQDIYDVNSNNNIEEKVGISTKSVQLLSPTSLITVETISGYNPKNEVTIAPNVAEVENIEEESSKQKQATINIGLTNNYPNTITGAQILGKIPFKGNTYILNEKDLESQFTTTMTDTGIIVPEELKEKTSIYYSEKENPTKDLLDDNNGWTLKEDIQDFSKIKTFLIDLKEYEITVGKEYTFSYNINLPENVEYNKVSYSNHAVYYELTTNGGNLSLNTEPNKVGVKIVKKFNLELTKYKTNSGLTIPGVTYKLKYQEEQDEEIKERTNIITTNNEEKISLKDLYVNREYKLQEIKAPLDICEQDTQEITFKINVDKTVEINGKTRNYNFEETNTLKLELEDEVKYKVHLVKQDEQGNKIEGITFNIKGTDFLEQGQKYTTNAIGQIDITGLHLGTQYTIEEIKANGYYLYNNKNNTIQFKIDRNLETGKLEITTWTQGEGITQIGTQEIQENENELVPTLNITLQNEKIPTYNLKLLKVNKENEPLNKAQFVLTSKDTGKEKMVTTNEAGEAQIEGLLEFIEGKYVTGEYTLKEIYAPEGYSLNKTELKFRATRDEEGKIQIKIISGGDLIKTNEQTRQKEVTSDASTLTLTILNTPIFNLTKLGENNELLPNAKFVLTDINGNSVKDVNGKSVGKSEYIEGKWTYNVVTTDENGNLSFNLKQGTYKLEEVKAPEGYELPSKKEDRIHYFGIDASQEAKKGKGVRKNIWNDNDFEKVVTLKHEYYDDECTIVLTSKGNLISYDSNGEEKDKLEGFDIIDIKVINGYYFSALTKNNSIIRIYIDSSKGICISTLNSYSGINNANLISFGEKRVHPKFSSSTLLISQTGGLALCDISSSYSSSKADFIWSREFPNQCKAAALISTEIENPEVNPIIIASYDNDYIVALDYDTGEELWRKSIMTAKRILPVNDGMILVGENVIIKINNNGDEQWRNSITYNIEDVVVTQNETIVLTPYPGRPGANSLLIINNNNGRIEFGYTLGVNRQDGVYENDLNFKAIATNYDGNQLDLVGDRIHIKYDLSKLKQHYSDVDSEVYCIKFPRYSNIINTKDGNIIATGKEGYIGPLHLAGMHSDNYTYYRNAGRLTEDIYNNNLGIKQIFEGRSGLIATNGISNPTCFEEYYISNNPLKISYSKPCSGPAGPMYVVKDEVIIVNNGYIYGDVYKIDLSNNITRIGMEKDNIIEIAGIANDDNCIVLITEDGKIIKRDYTAYNMSLSPENQPYEWKVNAIEKGKPVSIISVDDGVVAISSEGEVVKYSNDGELIWRNNEKGYAYTRIAKAENGVVVVSSGGEIVKYDGDGEIQWEDKLEDFDFTGVVVQENGLITAVSSNGYIVEYTETDPIPVVPETANIEVRNNLLKYNITTEIGVNSENLRIGGSITGEYNDTYKESNNIKFVETIKHGYDNQKAITITPDEGYVIKEIKVNGDILNFIHNEDVSCIIPEGYFKEVTKNYHIVVTFAKISDTLILNKVDSIDKTKFLPEAKFRIERIEDRPQITNELGSLTNNGTYYFTNENGTYISNNKGVQNTTANSYIPIDLTNRTGKYTLTVNAEVSSQSGYDIGYATVTNTTSAPKYNSSTGRFIYISGKHSAGDYKTVLEGGYKYYLHLGYRKNNLTDTGEDIFKVNSIQLSLNTDDFYNGELTTNANGQIIQTVPFGKYRITELEAPEGYVLDSTPKEVTLSEGNCNITIENKRLDKVIVHHYLENTGKEYETKAVELAEDEVLKGKTSQEYITSPNMNIEHYALLKDEEGEYIIPENASGTYKEEEQEVFYYYNQSQLKLTVHHYLEGTEDKLAEDENSYYEKGEHYKTSAKQDLLDSYEIVEVKGDEEKDIIQNEEVTYYYRIKKHNIITRVYIPEGQASKGGTISGEDEKAYEIVDYKKSSTKDIIITPYEGYKIKQIVLASIDEEENKKVSIIYGENKTENPEITYKENIDGSIILTKFENMKEDKQVIVQFERNEGKIIVHHYIEETEEKIYEDQINIGLVGNLIKTDPVKVEDYILIQEPTKREETIEEQAKEITYYYQKQYKITTNLIKYEEPNEQGEMEEVIGGTITGKGEETYEEILKGRNNQKEIEMRPNEGFTITKITINGEELDYTKLLKEDGSILLEKEYFKNINESKHIEVEFRRKTKIYVKYLEKETNKKLADEEEIQGYVGKDFETTRKNITNYKTAEIGSNLGITNEQKEPVEPSGQMTKDEQTIIYWYEKIPSGILVKHIEKVTIKEINPETNKEETKIIEIILDEEEILGYAGEQKETKRKEFQGYIPAENNEKEEGINIKKDENSKEVTMKQDEIIEVIYWYEREFKIITEVVKHSETDAEGNTKFVRGGTISGDEYNNEQEDNEGDNQGNDQNKQTNKTPYETVIKGANSTKEIKITPDSGYQIKYVIINGKELYIKDKIQKDKTLILVQFQNMQEDKYIQVAFEKIPTKIIVKYKDAYTKESIKEDKEIQGYVNDQYNEQRIEILGYVKENPEPQNEKGQMTEETIVITYWYTKEYKITTEVIKHEEQAIDPETGEEKTSKIKGGSISGDEETPYEIVLRGKTNQKEIIIVPENGYQIKELKINNKTIETKDLIKEDGSINMPKFENIQEDKHIQVEFEKIPAKVIIKYLEEGTENVIYKTPEGKDYEEIQGYVNQNYKTEPKEIKYYELVEEKYPENSEGKMEKENKDVIYYYKKLPFNMKIEKEIENIKLNKELIEVKDKKSTKVEIEYKDIKEIKLEITYKLKVTNTEKIPGKAEIEEQIPDGFEFQKESSDQRFNKKDEKYILQTEEINPGETKEYKVTLKWRQDEKNKGEKQNIAKLVNTSNIPNFEETTKEDNEDKATVEIKINKTIKDVIDDKKEESKGEQKEEPKKEQTKEIIKDQQVKMPKTGQTRIIYIIVIIVVICLAIIIWKKKKEKEKNKDEK